jgi:hypothetical protein
MRRFFILLVLSALSLPMGISVVGCHKGVAVTFCNGGDSGLEVGQVADIKLNPQVTGISLNYDETQQIQSPVATDCKGNTVAQPSFAYGTTNMNVIDVSPTGALCAGNWNRNSAAGIASFTTCTATNQSGVSYITATSGGATSNTVAVFAHPQLNSIVLSPSTATNGESVTGCVSQGNTVTLNSVAYNGATAVAGIVSNIYSYSVASNVVTFNTPLGNTLQAGQLVVINGFGASLSLSAATPAVAGSTTYTGAIVGGASNALVGEQVAIANFDQGANNGTFTISASTATTITVNNGNGVADTASGTATPTASGTAFNGLVATVLTTGLSSTQFEASFQPGLNFSNTTTTNEYATATTTIGNVIYAAVNSTVAEVEDTTEGLIAALEPGATLITAQLSDASSSAGYFYTCPPKTITIVPGFGTGSSVVVDTGFTDPLTATAVDTNGVTLTGLALTYYSSTPATTVVSSTGVITADFPGSAVITAECLPQTCNPAPLTQTGVFGTGTPVTSNSEGVSTPGTTATILYMASTNSQYYAAMDFTTQTIAPPVRLPYAPSSLVSDPLGANLYFGSPQELMIVTAASGALAREDITAPGNVIGISPSGATLVISDNVHDLLYFYNTTTFAFATYGGSGTKAVFTPDSQTAYISGGAQEWVYSSANGFNTYQSPTSNVNDVTVPSPAVGAFFAGTETTARSYCPVNTSGSVTFYPSTSDVQPPTVKVTATNDGNHVIGANLNGTAPTLYDFGITPPIQACPTGSTPNFASNVRTTLPLSVAATAITGVDVASNSTLSFLTYTAPTSAATTGAILPGYAPATTGAGLAENVTLKNGASAPVAGVFSPDNQYFYAGTSGDNELHIIYTGNVQITGWTITGDVVTFTASNALTAGQTVTLSGFGTSTFFNGQTVTVLSTGLNTTQFEANFNHANGNNLEFGLGSTQQPVDTQQLVPNLPLNGATGQYATPNLLVVKPRATT